MLWNVGLIFKIFLGALFLGKKIIADLKVLFWFWGGQKLDLLLTREESGVSNSGFSKKNYASLSFLVKSSVSFSISGKLHCGVGVNFKPLLKIWICEGVMLDKFKTLRWIISSSFVWLLLYLSHDEKNYLLWNCSYFHQLGSEHLMYLTQLWYVHFVDHYYWFRFRHQFLISIVSNLPSCLCLCGLILWKNYDFFLFSSFEASTGVAQSLLAGKELYYLALFSMKDLYHCRK